MDVSSLVSCSMLVCKTLCHAMQKRRIPEDMLACITLMVLKGLFQLHKQMHIVHRDIKPANVLLSMDGVAKISDFGISRPLDNTMAMCETWQGTTIYMSPERLQSQPYGFSSDIWSLGVCLAECATGKYPYDNSGGPIALMAHVRPFPHAFLIMGLHLSASCWLLVVFRIAQCASCRLWRCLV